jgi:hypothetical protein
LNTESNEINFPDGYSVDEQNYELLVDGSRKRRKGLANESGGSTKSVATVTTTQRQTSFKWRAVGGDPTKHFIVHQVGSLLYFTDDAETLSTVFHTDTIDLSTLKVDSATTDATIANTACQLTQGRGHLMIAHPSLKPAYVEYDSASDAFNVNDILILVRDFEGLDDGTSVSLEPTSTITEQHRYNLRNRGWKQGDMDAVFSGLSKHPAKNAIWYKGYKRTYGASVSELDGTMAWDNTKYDAEAFGNASAPQGSLLLDPLDTTYAVVAPGGGDPIPISTSGFNTGSGTAGGTIRMTVTAHGRTAGDEITISGCRWTYRTTPGAGVFLWDYNGDYTINNPASTPNAVGEASIVDANTIDIYVDVIDTAFTAFVATLFDGQIDGGDSLNNPDGTTLTVGPSAIGFQAGRVWYGGIADSEWADTIFFSKIAQKSDAYGHCHQVADPTDSELNALQPTDGGTIIIPNLGSVKRFIPLRNAMLVFTDQGVWEIGGGRRGFITADGYSVRKITEAECSSALSPIQIDNGAIFTGPKGIFRISPNEFTSQLEAENLSESLIQTLWNEIPAVAQQICMTAYDDALKRVYFLYGDTGDNVNQYANALILDLRAGAFFKYKFNVSSTDGILGIVSITDSDSIGTNQKIKWICQTTATQLTICDLSQSDYLDYDGAESPLPFVTTGWDNIGDFQSRRQAPIITVYAKRTETGYTSAGGGWTGDNESSNLLTAYWDWTDDSVTGKIGSQNETYRHVRQFVPSGTTDVDGYPVVVTRNKVRGRGRVLQLRFDGAATKDSHILGFTTNYKITRKA